ncbi:GNAT family N-acetyltransferase [Solwaraspora sp. WMMD406]|uniref:GNAT family N-acetyltransferase n=1 Tax=Solwaraspora sp. WMMD406 TaxID=3016095 RepID=UPI002416D59D|nr:GNAT family N-acetyltransferase [Solwaraspora sp. WMMD406]MDG4767679.1 GNAT family N-acetyltransferase [Solwaraspora sp. WMMD406]
MTATTPATAVRNATHDDIAQAATLLTEAFLIAPVSQWLVTDIDARVTTFRTLFTIELEHALDTGGLVHIAGPIAGVAIWHRRQQPVTVDQVTVHQRRMLIAAGAWQHRVAALDTLLGQHHPNEAHHYLGYLAVTPWLQNRGIGTALLRHHHRVLDQESVPAYLEATTPRNRELYLRHGYQPRGPVRLPDGPPLWPMWRTPLRPVTSGPGAPADT